MNKQTRIEKIQSIENPINEVASMEILWQDSLVKMPVYKIPLSYLIYNKYNGRILSRTKSLETQNNLIDPETPEGKKIIEKLLYESNVPRNEQTLKDLKKFGQKKYGIITKDGIIIDGNRRAMLLNRDYKDYFKAVILPVTLEENPIEIEKLETSFQLAEDEKLGYNPIEKYIKTKVIYLKLMSNGPIDFENLNENAITKIAQWMGETTKTISKYLRIINLMDEYLDYCNYTGIYTQLDGREDQFISLEKWLNNLYGENSTRGFDGYTDLDVDDLKFTAFDYIRIKNHYDGKQFRILGDGVKENNIFGYKNIWKKFLNRHNEIKESMEELPEINYKSEDLKSYLDSIDDCFYKNSVYNGESLFITNLNDGKEQINFHKDSAHPGKLVSKAFQALENISIDSSSLKAKDIQEKLVDISLKAQNCILKDNPELILNQVIDILGEIDISDISETEEESIKYKLKVIEGEAHQLSKLLS